MAPLDETGGIVAFREGLKVAPHFCLVHLFSELESLGMADKVIYALEYLKLEHRCMRAVCQAREQVAVYLVRA